MGLLAASWLDDRSQPERAQDPAIGYRVWRFSRNRLRSMVAGTTWQPGVAKVAKCGGDESPSLPQVLVRRPRGHRPPEPSCACGIYANHDLKTPLHRAAFGTDFVVGAICCWGRVVLHHEGFRAEYAALIGLCVPANRLSRSQYVAEVERMGREYRVPVFFEARHLQQFAGEFGVSYGFTD